MTDWKEDLITDYIKLQSDRVAIEEGRAEDEDIKHLKRVMEKATKKLSMLEQPYSDKLLDITRASEEIHEALINRWDIADKTCEYDIGCATIRTTKSLNITDKKRLIAILLNIEKLPEAVRSWNLSYLRKLKDVGMIEDTIAYYDEHQNVIIKGVSGK